MNAMNAVTATPPAATAETIAHFTGRLALETDCSDVAAALAVGDPGFVLVDVRGTQAFARGHVPGAINIPHRMLTPARLADFASGTLFVVYCAGPHCNGGDKGALRLAELGRPVKLIIGGVAGWIDEGFALATAPLDEVAGS